MDKAAKRRVWGWWFFDWASQPYHTVLLTFTYGPFFASVAAAYFIGQGLSETVADAEAQALWSWMLTISGLIVGIGAPFMGAFADSSGRRRPWIAVFSAMTVIGAAGLWFTDPAGSNMWAMLVSFGLGFVGVEYALIFINAQLPGLVDDKDVGKVSGSGFAFGYIGGLVALAITLIFLADEGGKTFLGLAPGFGLLDPATREGTRAVGPMAAIWYVVFMIPYVLWVHDRATGRRTNFASALSMLTKTLKSVAKKRSTAAYLLSSMFYRDALNGLYSFGGVYAILVLNWSITLVGVFGILSGASAALISWLGGKADSRIGPKPVIKVAIVGLMAVIVVVLFMTRESLFGIPLPEGSNLPDIIFFACGVVIGGFGGMLQAASRSLMVRHADPETATEAFGLYGLSGRATAFMAPALIGLFTTLTGSARLGVSPLIGLFLVGLVLLVWVKPEGERA